MRLMDEKAILSKLNGRRVDFYLEDDMFEIEGIAYEENDRIVIRVLDAVGHVLEMSGDFLELQVKNRRLYAKRIDTGKVFEMEINRIYERMEDPAARDFLRMKDAGVEVFFKKPTDTLVWFDEEQGKWLIELNKINMYFSGIRTSYATVDQLFESNRENMDGIWQAVSFSSTVEEGEAYGEDSCGIKLQKV